LILLCSPQIPHGLPRGPACRRGIAGIGRSLLTPAVGERCGLADRRIVIQIPEGGIFSHVMQSDPNCSCGQLASSSIDVGIPSLGTGGRCEVTTYFSQVARLSNRGAISPLPTCVRL